MKKKLLSLVLAGAMVATTSVSAFADKKIEASDNTEPTTDVTITGQVANDGGNLPAGRFNVTVPTTAAFTVNKEGEFFAPDKITIKNEGAKTIDVYAERFVDSTKVDGEGITVVKESELTEKKRTYVSLNIYGSSGNVYLKTEQDESKKGLYKDNAFNDEATTDADLKLASISAGDSGDLTLEGKAGKKTKDTEDGKVQTAVSNNFTLTLKIKKGAN